MNREGKLQVMVLMGGTSSERNVSLSTGKMILDSLDNSRYDCYGADISDLLQIASASQDSKAWPDIVFIALHGRGGEDGTVQGLLEILSIPYTGSGVLASALAMDKKLTKQILSSAGLSVVPDISISRYGKNGLDNLALQVKSALGEPPFFVKPNSEGSTYGCSLVETWPELLPAMKEALCYDRNALIEPFVRGVEITVGVLCNDRDELEALPVIEIVPNSVYYDYKSKYEPGGSKHIIPARLPARIIEQAKESALYAHQIIGCRGMSRTDFIVQDDHLLLLEINTIPGMTPTSLLPDAAAHAGISFSTLLDRLLSAALRFHNGGAGNEK